MARNWISTRRKKRALIGENVTKGQWKAILIAVVAVVYVAAWVLIWQFCYNLSREKLIGSLLLAVFPALVVAAAGLYLYKKKYPTPEVSGFIYITLILGSVAIPGITYVVAPQFYTLAPEGGGPPIITAENATLTIQIPGDPTDITGLCEVQLWRTTNQSNLSAWTQLDISGNWTSTVFYKAGWLNADRFNFNLSFSIVPNKTTFFYIEVRAWWKLAEWQNGTYTPPSSWSWTNFTPYLNYTTPYIEENETCVTWTPIGSGMNTILLTSEPYTLYGGIRNFATLQPWDDSDGAYSDNYTTIWDLAFTLPANETHRGFDQTYDWIRQEWYGCWLIASSNDSQNIYNYYNDSFGNSRLLWYNTTVGRDYKGVIFNDSLITSTIYDTALLLPRFNYDWSTQAQIQIKNGSSGIHWYLGKGYESNIQVIRKL